MRAAADSIRHRERSDATQGSGTFPVVVRPWIASPRSQGRRSRAKACGLLAALLPFTPALADEMPCARHIGVTGHASSAQAPDFAEIAVGIEAKGSNAAAALDAASKAVAGISAIAREAGLSPAEIGTAAVTLQAATRTINRPGGVTEQPDGYVATNVVRLRLGDMARLGDILRRTLESGANRIDGITFGLRDPEGTRAALQVAAAKDARSRAAALAEAVGAKLGGLCTLTALENGPAPYAMRAMAAPAKARPVPIEAGTIESAASVQATFALDR